MSAVIVPVTRLAGVSDEFVVAVGHVLPLISAQILQLIASSGVRVLLAPRLSLALPQWAAEQPRGWPAEQTWDHAEACYDPESRYVVIGEFFHDPRAGNRLTPHYRLAGCVLHEMGHAFDDVCAPAQSDADEFRRAHAVGRTRCGAGAPARLQYECSDGKDGAEELFAEAFALLHGHGSGATREDYDTYFPEALHHVGRLLSAAHARGRT